MGDADGSDAEVCGLCEDECACARVRGVLCEFCGGTIDFTVLQGGDIVHRLVIENNVRRFDYFQML